MSQVSAMILAMVSNVEDICNSLVDLEFWQAGSQRAQARATAPDPHFYGKTTARIAKQGGEFNGSGHLAGNPTFGGFGWKMPGNGWSRLPAVLAELDRRATTAPRQDAILVLPHRRHCVGKPDPGTDKTRHENECEEVHDHPVPVIVRRLSALILGQIGHSRRVGIACARVRLPTSETHNARSTVGGGKFPVGHFESLSHPLPPFEAKLDIVKARYHYLPRLCAGRCGHGTFLPECDLYVCVVFFFLHGSEM